MQWDTAAAWGGCTTMPPPPLLHGPLDPVCPPSPPKGKYWNGRTPQEEGGAPPPWTPRPKTKVTIAGPNEIYNRENIVGPFLVHKLLGLRPPPPLSNTPRPRPLGVIWWGGRGAFWRGFLWGLVDGTQRITVLFGLPPGHEGVHQSSSWEVLVLNRVRPPKVPPTPSLSSPQLAPRDDREGHIRKRPDWYRGDSGASKIWPPRNVRARHCLVRNGVMCLPWSRGCHKDAHPLFFFILWHPLSDVWWLPSNRHRLPTNRHRLPTNRHRLHTNRHRLHTNRHRLPTNSHRLPTGIIGRIGHSEFFFFFHYGTPCPGDGRTGGRPTVAPALGSPLTAPRPEFYAFVTYCPE